MTKLRLDFVSDIACPWCAIGLKSLEKALDRLGSEIEIELHFQPFELNPQMPREGEDITEHIAKKYGSSPEQTAQNREMIRARGASVGFTFDMQKRGRIYNTFDAHRLLHWAGEEGKQRDLKLALLTAYFTDGKNPSEHATLIEAAGLVGLDTVRAKNILASDEFAKEVREREQFYLNNGIHAVPSVVVNNRHLIQGGQPPEVFEQALRGIAKESEATVAS
jgi:predicted DsbA family dithiol-disulfide isomerase